MRTLSDVLLATIQLKLARHVHLLELRYGTSGVLRLTDAAADVDADVGAGVVTWAGGADWSEFGSVEETTDRDAQSVRLALSGVDQGITAILLANDFRGRLARIWRAWIAVADNYVSEPDFTQWVESGTCSVTAGQTDPFGGTLAYLMNAISSGSQRRFDNLTVAGDGEKGVALYLREGSAGQNDIVIRDETAGVVRTRVRVTWTSGIPALSIAEGSATLFGVVDEGLGWYRIRFATASLIAANNHRYRFFPGSTAGTGSVYAFGPQFGRDARALTPYQPADGAVVEAGGQCLPWSMAS